MNKIPPSINDIISKEAYEELKNCKSSISNEFERIANIKKAIEDTKQNLDNLTNEYKSKSSRLIKKIERLNAALDCANNFLFEKESELPMLTKRYWVFYNAQ